MIQSYKFEMVKRNIIDLLIDTELTNDRNVANVSAYKLMLEANSDMETFEDFKNSFYQGSYLYEKAKEYINDYTEKFNCTVDDIPDIPATKNSKRESRTITMLSYNLVTFLLTDLNLAPKRKGYINYVICKKSSYELARIIKKAIKDKQYREPIYGDNNVNKRLDPLSFYKSVDILVTLGSFICYKKRKLFKALTSCTDDFSLRSLESSLIDKIANNGKTISYEQYTANMGV